MNWLKEELYEAILKDMKFTDIQILKIFKAIQIIEHDYKQLRKLYPKDLDLYEH